MAALCRELRTLHGSLQALRGLRTDLEAETDVHNQR